jgi:hypothetical protein
VGAAVLSNNDVIVLGGGDEVDIYRVASLRWETIPALVFPRSVAIPFALDGNIVLVPDGRDLQGKVVSSEILEVDMIGAGWNPIGSMVSPPAGVLTRLGTGAVLSSGAADGEVARVRAERFDAATRTWSAVSPLAQARAGHFAVELADGRVLVGGGMGSGGVPLASAEIFNPSTGAFETTAAMTIPRSEAGALRLTDGRVLVTGGRDVANRPLASAEIYDPTSGTWLPPLPMMHARARPGLTTSNDGRVLVAGGLDETEEPLAASELFILRTTHFESFGTMMTGRVDHAQVALGSTQIYAMGGDNGAPLASTELYCPEPLPHL